MDMQKEGPEERRHGGKVVCLVSGTLGAKEWETEAGGVSHLRSSQANLPRRSQAVKLKALHVWPVWMDGGWHRFFSNWPKQS